LLQLKHIYLFCLNNNVRVAGKQAMANIR